MREYILEQLKHYYIPLYGNRFLFEVPERKMGMVGIYEVKS